MREVRLTLTAAANDNVVTRVNQPRDEEGTDVAGSTDHDNSHPDNVRFWVAAASSTRRRIVPMRLTKSPVGDSDGVPILTNASILQNQTLLPLTVF